MEADIDHQIYLPERVSGKVMDAIDIFTDNLCHANKEIRLSTLRILCYYEPLSYDILENDIPAKQIVNVCDVYIVYEPIYMPLQVFLQSFFELSNEESSIIFAVRSLTFSDRLRRLLYQLQTATMSA